MKYLYHCNKCGRFIIEQPMTDATLNICPHCGQPIYRVIQNVNIDVSGCK